MNTGNSAFSIALMQELMGSMTHWYGPDNWDSERFGPRKFSLKSLLVTKFNEIFSGKVAVVPGNVAHQIQSVSRLEGSIEGLSIIYDLLANKPSRSTLVKVVAYRLMGHRRVKLPLNNNAYWPERRLVRSLIKSQDTIKMKFLDWELKHFALEEIGYPIEIYLVPFGVFATFILRQYEYRKRVPAIKAENGDYVIDAGGCWGDTALYFAHLVGDQGKVYTFEFVPDNLEILRRNVSLNPCLSKRIEVVLNALWDRSGEEIAYSDNGPGTSLNSNRQSSSMVSTVSIDDFVMEKKLPRVDLIKMDIEGAELNALQGAEKTIRAFRPKLAISVYHREHDLEEIPDYLNRLAVGYEFFIDHFTIYHEETMLFASPKAG